MAKVKKSKRGGLQVGMPTDEDLNPKREDPVKTFTIVTRGEPTHVVRVFLATGQGIREYYFASLQDAEGVMEMIHSQVTSFCNTAGAAALRMIKFDCLNDCAIWVNVNTIAMAEMQSVQGAVEQLRLGHQVRQMVNAPPQGHPVAAPLAPAPTPAQAAAAAQGAAMAAAGAARSNAA